MEKERTLLVIFPGWASFSELYKKLNIKYEELLYFDELKIEKFYYKIKQKKYDRLIFLAWSMGTMVAIKLLGKIKPDKLILICPTLNFVKTTKPIVIKKMIKNLEKNKILTIREFNKINFKNREVYKKYIDENLDILETLEVKKLNEGLKYLLKENLEETDQIKNIKPLIVLAKYDEIINYENSKDVINKFQNYFLEFVNSGHNVIYESEIEKVIGSYLSD